MISSSSITSYTSALGGSGVGIKLYGEDLSLLQEEAKKVGKILEEVEEIDSVDNGLTEAELEYHFAVNKKAAMENGLTVAQVYMQVAKVLTESTTSTQLSWEGDNYDVIVNNPDAKGLTIDELKNITLTGTDITTGESKSVTLGDRC